MMLSIVTVLSAAVAGLIGSVVCEHTLLQPVSARSSKSLRCLVLHTGVWCTVYGLFVLVTGRPVFSMALALALFVTLILVNNAKYTSLKEPYIFQDYDYFLDTIRCPRLFLPFLGIKAFCLAAVVIIAALAGFLLEVPPASRWELAGQGGAVCFLLLTGLLFLVCTPTPSVGFQPTRDLEQYGFLVSLYLYAKAQKGFPEDTSPFSNLQIRKKSAFPAESCARTAGQTNFLSPVSGAASHDLPHLVAVQSESFFDPRPLWNGIRPELLSELDRLQKESPLNGHLHVPARGANTIRTEFAFLTGIPEEHLGIHRFNPYRALAHGWQVSALPAFLKTLGYRTVCLHPYLGSFYFRRKILPGLGFDHFEDISFFKHAARDGAYISDAALSARLVEHLEKATQPTFILAITMENHGPLHLEKIDSPQDAAFYTEDLPAHCEELSIYLRHLCHANAMIGTVRSACLQLSRPVSLCWYGDHIPIMPAVYTTFGEPDGTVPYACWNSWKISASEDKKFNISLQANELSIFWIKHLCLLCR